MKLQKGIPSMNAKHDFTQGNIFKKLIQFMLPILGALVLQAMYGAVDLLIVGRFGTHAGISAVSTGTGIMNLITFVLNALAAGVTILIGRYLGAKETHKISKLIGSAVAFFFVLAIALSVLLLACAGPIAVLMQAPREAVSLTTLYIRICGAGLIFVVFYNFISSIFRGMGNSRLPLIFVAISCVINIAGDFLLVAIFHMDVAGAAIATIAAQAVSVLMSLVIIRRQQMPFAFSLKDIRLEKEAFSFIRIGAPLALQEFLTNLSFLALAAFVNRLGLDASNGHGIAQKIQSFIMLVPSAIIQSMASFVAQNVGAGKEKRAKQGMMYGMAIGAGIGVLIASFIFAKGDLLASAFSGNPQDISRAFEYLRGFAPDAIATSISFSFLGYFNGHSKSAFTMLQGIFCSFFVRLPMAYIMSIQPDASLTGIGLAAPVASVVGIVISLFYYRHMQKQIFPGEK